ncbi:MAG TPA: LysR family transcriptional regulator [Bradyrhizobium sp.]
MDNADIDLIALRGFCVLMGERSVSRAATRLGVKQPTMSRMLGKLRRYFDDPLLVWAGGHMVPTPRALALEAEILHVLATMKRLAGPSAPAFDPASSETTMRLVATGYLENLFLGKVMGEVATRAPKMKIEIRPPDHVSDVRALENGDVDFLVGWNLKPAPILRSRLLFTDRLVCIARADHPALRQGGLTYDQYVSMPQVQYDIPGKTTTGQLLEERLSRDGHRHDVKYRVQNFDTVAEVVANTNLIATLSERLARRFLDHYRLRMIELPIRLPPMRNSVFWHERMQSDPRSRWFRKLLADAAKSVDLR